MEDWSDAERACYEGQRMRSHNRYMDAGLMKRFSAQKRGDPFDFPESPDELELMVGWFFDRLRVIISIENMSPKFDGIHQVLDILQDAADINNINIKFDHHNGQWYINGIEGITEDKDILHLPSVLKTFSRLYRHHATKYSYGDREDIELLMIEGD